jgi:hypothetical protein
LEIGRIDEMLALIVTMSKNGGVYLNYGIVKNRVASKTKH